MAEQVERVPIEEAVLSLDPEAVDLDLPAILDDVERAIDHLDLDVGLVTDEELHWLSDVEVVSDDELDAPRLGELSPEEREIAVEAVLHAMLARGDLRIVGDDEVMAAGRYALRAAAWLLRALAPDRLDASDGEPATASTVEGLPVDTHDLAAQASRTALLTTGRATTERVQHGSFTTYLIDIRLHVLGGWTSDGGEGQVNLEALGEPSSAAWARWVVEEAIRPDPGVFTS